MSTVNVVMGNGTMVTASSNNHDVDSLTKAILDRQQIANDYCVKKGWSTNPAELSFEQILEIRKQQEWIDAGK